MSNFANPELDTFNRHLILPSGTYTGPVLNSANVPTKGLSWATDGYHFSGFANPVNSDDVANKAYVDAAVGGGGANTALSNLAAVAINTSLVSDTDATDSLGSALINWSVVHAHEFRSNTNITLTASELIVTAGDFGSNAAQFSIYADYSGGGFPNILLDSLDQAMYVNVTTGEEAAAFDTSGVSGETRMLLWDVDSGALVRVSSGANDSGGTGFRALIIPNA